MSERRTTGSRVFAARGAKGLSLRRAARRLAVSPRALRNWERGREDIPFAVRQAMVALYGIPSEQLIPERPTATGRQGDSGMIRIGSLTFALHEGDDDSLRAFLAAVRRERGLAPDAPLAVRASDATVLADLLGGTSEDIVRNLQRLLGIDEGEAVELSRWMFHRTAIAGTLALCIVVGAAGTGALSANPPAANAAEITTSETVAPPFDPDWAVIGDAAVLYRDE